MLIGLPSRGIDSKSHNARTASYVNCSNWQKMDFHRDKAPLRGAVRSLSHFCNWTIKSKAELNRAWFSTQARYFYPLWKGRGKKNLRCSSAKQKAFPCKHLYLFAGFTALRGPVVVRLSPVRNLIGGEKPLLD